MTREQAEKQAMDLVELFNNPGGEKFYLKCVYHIPEGRLKLLVETAKGKRSPANYFSKSANNEMKAEA